LFSVIIVNYNGEAYLRRAVEALAGQSLSAFEAFIVDNGSTDRSLASLSDLDDRFRVIKAGENLGFAAGNNLAAVQARADWIVTLNPDAFARPDWLANLCRAITRNPHVTMLGSMQIAADNPDLFDGTGDEVSIFGVAYRAGYGKAVRTITEDFPVFGPCAAAAAYRRDHFEAAGGFDERFFCYHEDVDLALKMRRLGGRAVQVHDAIVDHVGSGITGTASDFAVYHGTRNRIWTWFASMPTGLMIALMPLHIGANIAYLYWSLFRPGRFSPTWRGIRDALRGLPEILRKRRHYETKGTVGGMLVWNPMKVIRRRNKVQ
ncbi:MAG: glycosyltransferase family 2 protein, partial [Pseudomonadota bacterium]